MDGDVGIVAPNAAGIQPLGIDDKSGGLAEVQRVRQYFPETWIWAETLTDSGGRASLDYEAPDSITTCGSGLGPIM